MLFNRLSIVYCRNESRNLREEEATKEAFVKAVEAGQRLRSERLVGQRRGKGVER